MNIEELKIKCSGRWEGIIESFGIDLGSGKHKPCPLCGGTDRFRYTNKFGNGDYICNQCGANDGLSLIMKFTGLDFYDTVTKINDIVGGVSVEPKKKETDNGPALNNLWNMSNPLTGNDTVIKYLHSRKIVVRPDNVRMCQECYESDTMKKYEAMIARIQNKDGKPICLHRTYLADGKKANVPSPKKMMPATEKLNGSAIRLLTPGDTIFKDGVLGIAEGIETAMSAAQLFGVATWAVMSSTLMESFEPPDEYKEIIIYSDNDANYTGQKSAYTLANRLYNAGMIVTVETPDKPDWNDELTKENN